MTKTMTTVGLTSRWVAASRALENESAQPLFRDPFARELAGEDGFAMRASLAAGSGARAFQPGQLLVIRTRFFDEALQQTTRASQIAQVVILAAGMDTRAFRLDWPSGTTLFEVDRDDVFDYKEPVLARLRAEPRCYRRVVRADLAHSWTDALQHAGFDAAQPSAVLIEGLLCYLPAAAVVTILDGLASITGERSWLGLDVLGSETLTSPLTAGYLKRLSDFGCPWLFGVSDPEAFLAEHGWMATATMAGDPQAHFGRWPFPVFPRSVPGLPRIYLVEATRARSMT